MSPSVSQCAQKGANLQWDVEKNENTTCTPEGENSWYSSRRSWRMWRHDSERQTKVGNSSGTISAMRYTNTCLPQTRHRRRKVSKDGGRRPLALSHGRHSLTRREKHMETFESQRCTIHKRRDHSHEDHVADFIRGVILIWYTRPCHSARPRKIQAAKIAVDREWSTYKTANVENVKSKT